MVLNSYQGIEPVRVLYGTLCRESDTHTYRLGHTGVYTPRYKQTHNRLYGEINTADIYRVAEKSIRGTP